MPARAQHVIQMDLTQTNVQGVLRKDIWDVVQGMLKHTLLKEAGQLDGMYQQALNRICNQVIAPYSTPTSKNSPYLACKIICNIVEFHSLFDPVRCMCCTHYKPLNKSIVFACF